MEMIIATSLYDMGFGDYQLGISPDSWSHGFVVGSFWLVALVSAVTEDFFESDRIRLLNGSSP